MSSLRFLLDGKGQLAPDGEASRKALTAWSGRYNLMPTGPDLLCFVRTPAKGGKAASPRVVLVGDTASFPLSDLIAFLSQSRWGGLVRVHGPDGERTVSLKDGEVRGATSDDPADRLGEVLVRLGYIKRTQLDEVLKDTPPSKVGRVLVERGQLKAHELYLCVQQQVTEIFHAMLLNKEGTFALVDHPPEDAGAMSLQLSTQSLLMDSIRKIDELAHFRQRIPHGRMYVVQKRSSDGKLEPEEERVLALVQGTRTVLELGQAVRLSEFDVTKVIFRLLEGGYVAVSESPVTGDSAVPSTVVVRPSGERPALRGAPNPTEIAATFNNVFREILGEVEKQGMGKTLLASANAALAGEALTSSPVLKGIRFEPDGTIPAALLAQQLASVRDQLGPDPTSALRQALSDLMFFLLFQAGELLETGADEELGRRVKAMLANLGE